MHDFLADPAPSHMLLNAFEDTLCSGKLLRIEMLANNVTQIPSEFIECIARSISRDGCGLLDVYLDGGKIDGWGRILLAAMESDTMQCVNFRGFLPGFDATMNNAAIKLSTNTNLLQVRIQHLEGFDGRACLTGNCTMHYFDSGMGIDTKSATICDILCTLNRAGRSYMIENNVVEKGVELLSKLPYECQNHDTHALCKNLGTEVPLLDCIFTHLRENTGTFFPASKQRQRAERQPPQKMPKDDKQKNTSAIDDDSGPIICGKGEMSKRRRAWTR
ncbi:MAG: hypothetical protein SGARI_006503 [Bacillariaceae sp.]